MTPQDQQRRGELIGRSMTHDLAPAEQEELAKLDAIMEAELKPLDSELLRALERKVVPKWYLPRKTGHN